MRLAELDLPQRPLRWLGLGLVVAGCALPFAALWLRAAAWQPPAPTGEELLELRPGMVVLQPGLFLMGSPEDEVDRRTDETQHEVTLTAPFAISRTEVTQGQYEAVMEKRPVADLKEDFSNEPCSLAGVDDSHPVVCVSWLEAVEYCNALSDKEGLDRAYTIEGEDVTWNSQANGYRLPTEAEWEYAARAGLQQTWVGTDTATEVCDHDNVADASAKEIFPTFTVFECDDRFATLAPVTAFRENRWRLWGMGGNAAEWVYDGYQAFTAEAVDDPDGDDRASSRVIRGGSWRYYPASARVASRRWIPPSYRSDYVGFRVARSLPCAF